MARERTRVVVKTVDKRGKSLIPASRIEIEESRSWSEDFRDVTEAAREADEEAAIVCLVGIVRIGKEL